MGERLAVGEDVEILVPERFRRTVREVDAHDESTLRLAASDRGPAIVAIVAGT